MFTRESFSDAQWYYIEAGKKCGFDVEIYANPEFSVSQMSIIFGALLQKVDLSAYKGFRADQLSAIALYATVGEDVTNIANKECSADRMHDIMEALEKGIKILPYCGPEFSDVQLHVIYENLKNGHDVTTYADPRYSPEQMVVLGMLQRQGIDITELLDPSISSDKMLSRALHRSMDRVLIQNKKSITEVR